MSIYSPMNDDERAGVVAPTPEPRCRHCDEPLTIKTAQHLYCNDCQDADFVDPEPLFEKGAEDALDTVLRYATASASARTLLTLLHMAGWRLSRLPSGVPVGEDTTPSVTPSCLACTGWTNDSGKKPVHAAGCREGMVERGAAALGTWINAKYPPAWVPGAARVVLNAALTGGSTPLADRQPEVSAQEKP